MKHLITFTAIAAVAASGTASAQTPTPAYSKPSGYVTETLKGDGAFNLIGLTLHQSPVASGVLSSVSSTKVSDSTTNFTTLLTPGSKYIIQFKSGSQNGGIQIVSSWGTASGGGNTVNDLVMPQNVLSMGVAAGDSYELRPAATLSSVFGASNQAGLKSGSLLSADIIWLPDGFGGFTKFYYSPGTTVPFVTPAGWKDSSGANAANQAIVYTDALFIQRRGVGDLKLVLTGQVKTTRTQVIAVGSQFSYVSSVFAVGTTLGTSGLEQGLKAGSLISGDVLWMQNAARDGYDKFYYSPGTTVPFVTPAGWKTSAGGNATTQPLTSGIIIQRRDPTNSAPPINPPSSYSNL